jgi:hypothetical protein
LNSYNYIQTPQKRLPNALQNNKPTKNHHFRQLPDALTE